ncbi:hypothetical protein FDG2_0958 [Candidatus Protofrankia californiensis]|uniref:Uncharacterized protein n=1 Tax=Candidatus Protofrankia californiensis TaxID=1839754 RepID=A0A1C3NUN9_9ACTN|nr:hypothetical protein FDG2_0958 [Candidatus Protofrankia californiensis]
MSQGCRRGISQSVRTNNRTPTPTPTPTPADRTVPELDADTVHAVGKLSEALEWVERARGHLYAFHQMSGHADLMLGSALEELENAGHGEIAERVRRDLFGRNVLDGRWTFQIVEEYDDGYYRIFVESERMVREALAGGRRHVYEARMKASERERAGRSAFGSGA